jgi:F-type H+-transporting ATPase subunit epsilon
MATLKLEIVTPEGTAFTDDVDMVELPGVEGEMGIYPMHIPLMTQLRPGELRLIKGAQEQLMAVGEGFVEITQTSVKILTDMAVEDKDIDEAETQAAIDRAKKALEGNLGAEEVAAVEAALQKSLVKMNLRRRRSGGG